MVSLLCRGGGSWRGCDSGAGTWPSADPSSGREPGLTPWQMLQRGGRLWVSAPGCGGRQVLVALGGTWDPCAGRTRVDLPGLECWGDLLAPILPSPKGKEDSHLLAHCNRNCHLPPPSLGLQNSEPGGEMKGWLANHSENSFAKAKQRLQGPSLPWQKEPTSVGSCLAGAAHAPPWGLRALR